MSYMIQGPSQRSQQGTTVRERERSPLGKVVAWWVERLAGTALQKPMETFLINSLLGRIAATITVSLVVGAVVDLSITFLHPFGIAATLEVPLTCGVLAALAGGGGGGPGGAVVGFLWGWVVGEVVDATTAEMVAHFIPPVVIQAISWLTATLAGWIAGRIASRCFAKLAKVRLFLARVIGVIAVIAALASTAFVLLQFAIWLHPHLPAVLPLAAKVIGTIWRPIVVLAIWVVVLAWPFIARAALLPIDFGDYSGTGYYYDRDGHYRSYSNVSVVEFHRRHPTLFATWLVFVDGAVLGTVALLLPEHLEDAVYIVVGLWILGIPLAGLVTRVAAEVASPFKALPPLVGRFKQPVVSPWLMQRMPVLHVIYVTVLWSTPMLAMLSVIPILAMLSGWVALPWLSLWVLFINMEPNQVSNWFISLGTLIVGSLYLVAFCALFTATYVYTGFVGAISLDVIVLLLLIVTAARWAITAKYRHLVFTGVLAAMLLGLNLDPGLRHSASAFGLVLIFNNHSGDIKEMAQVSGWLGVAEIVAVAFVASCALIVRGFHQRVQRNS